MPQIEYVDKVPRVTFGKGIKIRDPQYLLNVVALSSDVKRFQGP